MTSDKVSLGQVMWRTTNAYWSHTNFGGLIQAYHAHGTVFRILWLSLFSYGLYLTIHDVMNVVNDYLARLHVSQMDIIYDRSALFPAVTVCNQNRIDCERLVLAAIDNVTYAPLQNIVNASSCLQENGLACHYLWQISANRSFPLDFIQLHEPFCFGCHQCADLLVWAARNVYNPAVHNYVTSKEPFKTTFLEIIGCTRSCGRLIVEDIEKVPATPEFMQFMDAHGILTSKPEEESGDDDEESTSSTNSSSSPPLLPSPSSLPSAPSESLLDLVRKRRDLAHDIHKSVELLGEHLGIPEGEEGEEEYEERPGLHDGMLSLLGASDFYNEKMTLMADFMSLPVHLREAVGAEFDDLIMECTFLGMQCDHMRFFTKVNSPQYGTCFTFNSNISNSVDKQAGKRTTGLTGELYSFNLLLYVKHYAYPPTLTATKGARVSIHPTDVTPDVEENGLNVMPNAATSFAIEQMTIKRLRKPYEAKCVSNWSEVDFYPLAPDKTSQIMSSENYNGLRCKKLCLQHNFYKTCGCFHPLFPSMEAFSTTLNVAYNASVRPCLLKIRGKDDNCTSRVQWRYDRQNITCNCPPSCYEVAYNIFPSTTFWPRDSYVGIAAKRMGFDVTGLTKTSMDELASNILEVKIFFKTLNTARLEQSPYISENSLMSALGGAMSLYLGISIIMLAEVLEYVFIMLWNISLFMFGRYKLPSVIEPDAGRMTLGNPNYEKSSLEMELNKQDPDLYPAIGKPVYNSPPAQ